jgi:erythromycin esterase-like protein
MDELKPKTEYLQPIIYSFDGYGQRRGAKIVVWAHNCRLGDARVTEMSRRGELNIGRLARERYGADAVLVGLTTYSGIVTAASNWARRTQARATGVAGEL